MNEIFFLVEENIDGGLTARSLNYSIFTEGDTVDELKNNIIDAVKCHFDDEIEKPKIIRLHYTREEIISYA